MNIEICLGAADEISDVIASYDADLAPIIGDAISMCDFNIENKFEVLSRQFVFTPDGIGGQTCGLLIYVKAVV